MSNNKNEPLKPIIKWPGGKEKEIKYIRNLFPNNIKQYYEPFLGGGAVFFHLNNKINHVNDLSTDLINFYKNIKNQDVLFFKSLKQISSIIFKINNQYYYNTRFDKNLDINLLLKDFDWLFTTSYINEDKEYIYQLSLEQHNKKYQKIITFDQNKELSNQVSTHVFLYFFLRYLYNKTSQTSIKSAIFFYLRTYCYSSMFRFNKNGDFNVPFGGISYTKTDFKKKINILQSKEIKEIMSKTEFYNTDYSDFINNKTYDVNDFMFIDPPYDSDFSSYDQNDFNKEQQIELNHYLIHLPIKWLAVMKKTDLIEKIYNKKNIDIQTFEKMYNVNFANRNNRKVTHLIIKNY